MGLVVVLAKKCETVIGCLWGGRLEAVVGSRTRRLDGGERWGEGGEEREKDER